MEFAALCLSVNIGVSFVLSPHLAQKQHYSSLFLLGVLSHLKHSFNDLCLLHGLLGHAQAQTHTFVRPSIAAAAEMTCRLSKSDLRLGKMSSQEKEE